MTIGGWICMLLAVGTVAGLFSWCCFKVVTMKDESDEEG